MLSHFVFFRQDDEDGERSSFGRAAAKVESQGIVSAFNPDARLISFLSGLLLSQPVLTVIDNKEEVQSNLLEAWSVGLLSSSIPWRMICSFTVSGILNLNPKLFPGVLTSNTIAAFFGRLPSTVARRVWAERAALPVCSRFVQAMVELLTSVKRAVGEVYAGGLPPHFERFWTRTLVDAATPVPFTPTIVNDAESLPRLSTAESRSFSSNAKCWEAYDGWVSSDEAWDVWLGSVEYMAVEWKPPAKSAVRALMDAGKLVCKSLHAHRIAANYVCSLTQEKGRRF